MLIWSVRYLRLVHNFSATYSRKQMSLPMSRRQPSRPTRGQLTSHHLADLMKIIKKHDPLEHSMNHSSSWAALFTSFWPSTVILLLTCYITAYRQPPPSHIDSTIYLIQDNTWFDLFMDPPIKQYSYHNIPLVGLWSFLRISSHFPSPSPPAHPLHLQPMSRLQTSPPLETLTVHGGCMSTMEYCSNNQLHY